MFSQLIESGRPSRRPGAQSFLSLAFHLVLGLGAIEASRQVVVPPAGPTADTQLFYTPPTPVAPPERHYTPELPASPALAPVPDRFVVAVPVDIPIGIPPIDPSRPNELWRFTLVPSRPGCTECAVGRPDSTTVFEEASVDQPVEVLAQAPPVYPRAFESMGVAGRVVLEYVVNTDGMVERGSVRVIETSHAVFSESAVHAIEASRFRPARLGKIAVKQLVRQAVRFAGRMGG